MKNILKKSASILGLFLLAGSLSLTSCNRSDDDSDALPQEEISNVTDTAPNSVTKEYDYQLNTGTFPKIALEDGHTYNVSAQFLLHGEDVTNEIIEAKDQHFLVYNFTDSDIQLIRTDDAASTRTDGNHIGLKTQWKVNKAVAGDGVKINIILYHESATISEARNTANGEWGKQTGGEVDADIKYSITK